MTSERTPSRVQAHSTKDVAAALSSASREQQRLRPLGAATWAGAWGLSGSPPGVPNETITLVGCNELVEYEPADLTMTVGAGVTLDEIADLTRPNGQWLALDPMAESATTIGATVATASAGALRTGFGGVREHVLGLTVVTGDGRVLELGGRVVKNVAGFDLLKLMVGGWGRFGVITQVTLRLNPLPLRDITLVYESDQPAALASVARGLATAPVVPAALRLDFGPTGLRLAARVVGGEASAPVEADILEAAAGGGRVPQRHEGSASAAWWTDQNVAPDPSATELALHFVPTTLVETVSAMGAAHQSGWRVRCDPYEGVCAVDGVEANPDSIEGCTALGASLRVLKAPGSDGARLRALETPSDEVVKRLVERLISAFDPAGVLG